jgi:hypothetical protein
MITLQQYCEAKRRRERSEWCRRLALKGIGVTAGLLFGSALMTFILAALLF